MRVAIVKLSSLGDVVHALPVAHALRRHVRDLHLTWIVEAREAALLSGQPDLDAVLPVDTRRWRRVVWTPGGLREVRATAARLRQAHFDVALDLQGLVKSGLLVACTRAPRRIGFALSHLREPLSALFTTCRVTPPPQAVHVVEQYLALLAPLGVAEREPVFNITPNESAEQHIEAFLGEQGVKPREQLVALNLGAGRTEKRWPVTNWRALAERLMLDGGPRVLFLWGPGEDGLATAASQGLPAAPIVAPPTTLHELAALLRRVTLLVAADTGPLHLGAALGTPCLGLYGPTRVARNGPYGRGCRGLQSPDGRMASLDPDTVFRAATGLLGEAWAASPRGRRSGEAE